MIQHRSSTHLPKTGTRPPLSGVRVVDFTSAWAGPMASRILAFLGAEVIKIEGPSRPDIWRGGLNPYVPDVYPNRQPQPDPLNRNCWFNTQSHNKLSLVVDTKDEDGQRIVSDIAGTADVVLANFSAGAMERMGFGYSRLAENNPKLIMIDMPAYGNDGPLATHRAMGPSMEALSGIASMIGYEDGIPLGSATAYLDPMGSLAGAMATMTALVERAASGRGQYVEVAQREAALHWIGEALLASDHAGESPRPVGNASADGAPHDAFPACGDDEWIAISIGDDDDWKRLCESLAQPSWKSDLRYATDEGRRQHARTIYGLIADITIGFDKHELAKQLQQDGVSAAPVNNAEDLSNDPHLRARGWFTQLTHPAAGVHDYPGLAIHLDTTPGVVRRCSPLFGEDTRRILRDILGYADEDIDRLATAGVIVDNAPAITDTTLSV